jgi:hypothetical protein
MSVYVILLERPRYMGRSRCSSVSVEIKLWAGLSGFESWQEQGFFVLATAYRQDLGLSQPPVHWVPGALTPRSYTSTLQYIMLACNHVGVCAKLPAAVM